MCSIGLPIFNINSYSELKVHLLFMNYAYFYYQLLFRAHSTFVMNYFLSPKYDGNAQLCLCLLQVDNMLWINSALWKLCIIEVNLWSLDGMVNSNSVCHCTATSVVAVPVIKEYGISWAVYIAHVLSQVPTSFYFGNYEESIIWKWLQFCIINIRLQNS